MPDDDNNLEDGDANHVHDPTRRLTNVAKNLARVALRIENLAGAVPPGPPHDETLKASLLSLQATATKINQTVSAILQRQ